MPIPFQPLGNRIFVRRAVAPTTTAGGLHIPETALRAATDRGVVVAVGPGGRDNTGRLIRVSVAVGDTVLFNRQAIEFDMPVEGGGSEKLVLVQEHEILGVAAAKPATKRGRPAGARQSSNVVAGDIAGRDIVKKAS